VFCVKCQNTLYENFSVNYVSILVFYMAGTLCILLQTVSVIYVKILVKTVQKYWHNQCQNIGVFYVKFSVHSM